MKPGTSMPTLFGVKIAPMTSRIASADTTSSCTRLETLPLITLLTRRPTSISSQ